jgi:hypothetical protein
MDKAEWFGAVAVGALALLVVAGFVGTIVLAFMDA